MKTEQEFNDWLKKRLRHGRRGMWPIRVARSMGMAPGVYFAYEKGTLPLTVYQLYRFMHVMGHDTEFIKQIFDD